MNKYIKQTTTGNIFTRNKLDLFKKFSKLKINELSEDIALDLEILNYLRD